ncbi:coiled-coil domain-containing protein 190 [Gastrophryne carolinensis]
MLLPITDDVLLYVARELSGVLPLLSSACGQLYQYTANMHGSKLFRNNADSRWESERRGAKRSEVLLSHGIQEIEDARIYHLSSMTKEQKQLQKDLTRIQQAAIKKTGSPNNVKETQKKRSTFQSVSSRNQPGDCPVEPVMASGLRMTLEMRINDFMDGVSNRKAVLGGSINDTKMTSRRLSISSANDQTQTENSLHPTSVENLTTNEITLPLIPAVKTLTEDSTPKPAPLNPQYLRQRRGSIFRDKPLFDEEIYAPDGGLRSCHTMPDLMESLEKAKQARYIRHKHKPESEKELTIGEIFTGNSNNAKR